MIRHAGPYSDDAGSDRVRGDDGGERLGTDAEQQGDGAAGTEAAPTQCGRHPPCHTEQFSPGHLPVTVFEDRAVACRVEEIEDCTGKLFGHGAPSRIRLRCEDEGEVENHVIAHRGPEANGAGSEGSEMWAAERAAAQGGTGGGTGGAPHPTPLSFRIGR
ncbi:hypothetical protein GCM10022384_11760 [Streptomyces marokkonensis]|uniref:Uncharacterized protein n=1 Tax=Streptomyces marokkonensis TaxID=324855 RepID=A0ABP7P780_9ACTN